MSSHQQFVQLLEQLTVGDNAIRSASEKHYESMKADAVVLPFLPLSLLEALADDTVAGHVRQLAAVLLRRLLVEQEDSVYRAMDIEKLVLYKTILIIRLQQIQILAFPDTISFPICTRRQTLFRSNLLICLTKEQDPSLKARICDIIGDLSGLVLECNEWPEILSYSQNAIQVTLDFV